MIRVVRDLASNKNGEAMEKNAYIHFVDELDFKGLSVVGKRKSKKNRAVGFFFCNSRQCEVRASTTKSKAAAAVKSEELCDKLEIKREELDREIKKLWAREAG